MIRRSVVALVLGVTAVACASSSTEEATASGAAVKTDPLNENLRIASTQYLGKIGNGELRVTDYTATPSYQSFGFEAKGGDVITGFVGAVHGDAMAWITDEQFHVLAANDDAYPGTLDAAVRYEVPEKQPVTSYRLVFRDYKLERHAITARLEIDVAAGVCQYHGQAYNPGDSFDSVDGCNSCACDSGGAVTCTTRICDCNPATEPWHTYYGTPAQCVQLLYNCPSGESHFANTCGCGCERPH